MNLTLQPESLDWALKHVEVHGDGDIFPVPFEFKAIRASWNDTGPDPTKPRPTLRDWLSGVDLFNWATRPYRRCLSPKHRFGFRVSTQLDPLDLMLFTAITYEIGADLEAARISKDRQIVHSHRFMPTEDGEMYDSSFRYESFRRRSAELADSGDHAWVVLADIADFFPRIYSHPLENALVAATAKKQHVKALGKMLNAWNFSVSYGIPVGPSGSRLLAELAINDVDAALCSEHYEYVRYMDDYRIFSPDERTAYIQLAYLANVLYENHGLTLQQNKTMIVPVERFKIMNMGESGHVRKSLAERFEEILEKLGIEEWYEPIDYDDLDEDTQKQIDSLNLVGLLKEQLESESDLNLSVTRFVLRRLGQLDDADCVQLVLDNVQRLYPVFPDVLRYLTSIRRYSADERRTIGERLLTLIDENVVGHLEFYRSWILHTFTHDREWDNEDRFVELFNKYSDEFTRRELVLALGRAGQVTWFKSRKRDYNGLSPWVKRAFIRAASCLPGDEARFWYRSVMPQLDELEKVVAKWAQEHPFTA